MLSPLCSLKVLDLCDSLLQPQPHVLLRSFIGTWGSYRLVRTAAGIHNSTAFRWRRRAMPTPGTHLGAVSTVKFSGHALEPVRNIYDVHVAVEMPALRTLPERHGAVM